MSSAQNIWLCRHGNRIDMVDPTWKGSDPWLSDDGVVQARQTGQRLRREPIRHIFASPFLRTVETASHIAAALDLPIKLEAGLGEWLNSEWFPRHPALTPLADLKQRFSRIDTGYRSVTVPQYPETAHEASLRAGVTARTLADRFGSDLLFVGHGHSVIGIVSALTGRNSDLACPFCGLFKIVRTDTRTVLKIAGDTSHLSAHVE